MKVTCTQNTVRNMWEHGQIQHGVRVGGPWRRWCWRTHFGVRRQFVDRLLSVSNLPLEPVQPVGALHIFTFDSYSTGMLMSDGEEMTEFNLGAGF